MAWEVHKRDRLFYKRYSTWCRARVDIHAPALGPSCMSNAFLDEPGNALAAHVKESDKPGIDFFLLLMRQSFSVIPLWCLTKPILLQRLRQRGLVPLVPQRASSSSADCTSVDDEGRVVRIITENESNLLCCVTWNEAHCSRALYVDYGNCLNMKKLKRHTVVSRTFVVLYLDFVSSFEVYTHPICPQDFRHVLCSGLRMPF